jgi:hypothetical protein
MTDQDFPLRRLVTLLDDDAYRRQRDSLVSTDTYLLEIDASGVEDRRELFVRARTALDERSGSGNNKWSWLEDQLWSSLALQPKETGVIVLRRVEDMLDRCLADLLDFVGIVTDLARRVYDFTESSFPHEMDLYLVLTGTGQSFAVDLS